MDLFRAAIEKKIANTNVRIEEIAGLVVIKKTPNGDTVEFNYSCDLSVSASNTMILPSPSDSLRNLKTVSDLFAPSTGGYNLVGTAYKAVSKKTGNASTNEMTRDYWHLRFRN